MTGIDTRHMEITSMSTDHTASRPRLTRQRQLILDRLDQVDTFLSAQQLHAALRTDGEAIGLATVYRGLQWLEDAGIVDAIRTADGEAAYRRCSIVHHHHLICRRCGRAVEVRGETLEEWSRNVSAEHGFTQPEHFVEIYGLCPECSAVAEELPATS